MIIITDQYSRSFTEILHTENEANKKLMNFIEQRENEINLKVMKISSDNSLEFINGELNEYFKSKGIKHEKQLPTHHETVERANRTILDMQEHF